MSISAVTNSVNINQFEVTSSAPVAKENEAKSDNKAGIAHLSDPLGRLIQIYSKYTEGKRADAAELAMDTSALADAIAEANMLWNQVMMNLSVKLDPSQPGLVATISHVYSGDPADPVEVGGYSEAYTNLNLVFLEKLNDERGIYAIIPSGMTNANYEQVQSINASMTAYSQTVETDIKTYNQDLENIMRTLSAAEDEARNTHQSIISFSQW